MQIIKSSTVKWIDIQNPSYKDIHKLMHDFNIHPLAANQLKDPTLRPMVTNYGEFLYIVLHFPIFDEEKQTSQSAEIDFIITPNMLLTARYQEIEPLETLLKKCSSLPTKDSDYCLGKGSIFLFYYIVKELFNFSLREIDHIHQKIKKIEEGIFSGQEKEMVSKISVVRRDIINFSGTLTPQKSALENLVKNKKFLDSFTRPFIEDLINDYHKVFDLINSKHETIKELQSTNESILNARTNEIMKMLTIMAFITFPLSLIASIFGMNTKILPIVGSDNDFWIIMGIMIVAMIMFFVFFKKRGWL